MLNTRLKSGQSGFTLIELMIGVLILAILAGIAIPSFQTMIRNTETRNATESILNGLQRARAEAVARNTNVTFVLGANSAWTVNVVNPASTIDSRFANDGSTHVTRTVSPALATTVTYNNVGQVVANADASATLRRVDLTAAGSNRDLRITIGSPTTLLGDNAKMCDPSMAPPNPRACS